MLVVYGKKVKLIISTKSIIMNVVISENVSLSYPIQYDTHLVSKYLILQKENFKNNCLLLSILFSYIFEQDRISCIFSKGVCLLWEVVSMESNWSHYLS